MKEQPCEYPKLTGGEYHKVFGRNPGAAMVFHTCKQCTKSGWIYMSSLRRKTDKSLCRSCSRFRGMRYKNPEGYIVITLPKNDPFVSMTHTAKNKIFEHRYLIAKALNRLLTNEEIVHHKNGIKDDNCLENLQIVVRQNHRGEVICPHCHKAYTIQ